MDRQYASDVLPSGNLFSELVDFTDTDYFDDQSVGECWHQKCHEMTTYRRGEPSEFGDFLQDERGDSPQKLIECDDLPQEEARAQPPSPLSSPSSLIPTTTYTIRTMTCVPLSDSNEPTGMSPEESGMSPLITDISPQMADISPQMIDISPQVTAMSPQMNVTSPKMTSISKQITDMSPQKIPSSVPVPHAKTHVKPRKLSATVCRNGYHCDFPNCNKVYARKKTLNVHKKVHTKPFLCSVEGCNGRFARSNCFNRHILSKHTASKQFHCRHCDKPFARSDHLAKHETLRCAVGRKLHRKNK